MEQFDAGAWDEAEQSFFAALEVLERENYQDSAVYANCLENLGFLYYNQERFDEAEHLFLQAKDILHKTLGPNRFKYIVVINDLGNLYADMGAYSKAKKFYQQAAEFFIKKGYHDDINYIGILNNLASIAFDEGNYEKALEDYSKVLNYYQHQPDNEIDLAYALHNIALTYSKLEHYRQAEAHFLRAIELNKTALGEQNPAYWLDLMDLAELYSKMGDSVKALDYSIKVIALNLGQQQLDKKISPQWFKQLSTKEVKHPILFLKALSLIKLQLNAIEQTAERYQLCKLALNYCYQIRTAFNSEEDKLRILEETANWSLYAIQSILDLPNAQNIALLKEEAFQFSELSKSVLLQTALQEDQAHYFGYLPDSIALKEQDLQAYYSELKAVLLEEGKSEEAEEIRSELIRIQRELYNLRQLIADNYPKYHQLKYAPQQIELKALQQKLDEKTAMISYSLGDSKIYAFCIRANQLTIHTIDFDQKEFRKRIRKFRKSLSDYDFIQGEADKAKEEYIEQAYWFYKLLLSPLVQQLNGVKQLVIIPDQELAQIPFEALLTKKSSSSFKHLPYLIHKYQLGYDYSARLWLENQTNQGKHNGLLLAAAANYKNLQPIGSDNREIGNSRAALDPLPEAKKEVLQLAQYYKGTFLLEENANEQKFKELASDYGIIHLAMHGILNKEKPILSALAFTETADSLEDNFLQAYEISQMRLHADLVVLSACETGYGKVEKGEGIMSLARSFMYAGVPSMIVSMWQINDISTALIMKVFYQELAKGKNKIEALQTAKLHYIEMGDDLATHPAFWAAFIQLGNVQPINIQLKQQWGQLLYWGIGLVFLLVLLAGFRFRKRQKITE